MTEIILIVIYAIAILLCVLLSSFFSGSEMSYSSCNRTRIENMAEDGDRRASVAAKIIEKFDDTLSTILIGNNLVNIAGSSIGTVLVITICTYLDPNATTDDAPTWISTLVLTLTIIIFGETIPKICAKKQANKRALKYAYIIRTLNVILKPLVVPVVALVNLCCLPFKGEAAEDDEEAAKEELTDIIEMAEEEKVLDEDASELVQAAIDFSGVPVYEVMTARVDMLAIDIQDDPDEIVKLINESGFTRIPVYDGSVDNIIGILSLNRYLRASLDVERPGIRSLLMPPKYVYKTMKLPNVLSELRKAKQHLAIVTDEYGGTLGVVSMEDVLEEIVGDIWDETDEVETEVVERSDGKWEIDGDMTIPDFLELLEENEDALDCDSDTVGGFAIETLEHFPESGESFCWKNYKITVIESDSKRVSKLLAERQEEEEQV